tara:strand:- start:588 stop:953 length:366 start_codon:yes stop_codon:yes gene_type:complete
MNDYNVIIKVSIPDCNDEQEAINFVADNVGLSEFNLEVNGDRESARKYINVGVSMPIVDKLRKAFEEPHKDCGIENLRDWIKARGFQIQMIHEQEEMGLQSSNGCHHCAYIENLLNALLIG